eukprot:1051659-Pleurochrysis_carterae.AAC.1
MRKGEDVSAGEDWHPEKWTLPKCREHEKKSKRAQRRGRRTGPAAAARERETSRKGGQAARPQSSERTDRRGPTRAQCLAGRALCVP